MKSLEQSRLRWWGLEPRQAAMLAAILVATALIYMPSLRNDWVWDDWQQIVQSYALHSWTGIGKSFINDSWWFQNQEHLPASPYYRPLQDTWIGLNWMALGDHPAAWHLEKILLELIGVMLSFRLAQLLTRNTTIALLAAAIFGMLPANVEPIVWANAIPEPLSALFGMGALCCFINRKPGLSRGWVFALMLYACAMLSHETAILFPLIVAAYVFLIERGSVRRALWLATPFIAVGAAYLCVRVGVLGWGYVFGTPQFQPPTVGLGWEKPIAPHGMLELILTTPVVLATYLAVLTLPGMAGPAHHVEWITGASPIAFVSAGALLLLVAGVSILVWRSPDRRLYLFCAAWSLLTLAPAMKLSALTTLVEDRLLYTPSFGWSLALALAAVRMASIAPRARAAVAGAMAILLAGYAVSVVRIEGYWHDNQTFFARRVAVDPDNMESLRALVEMLNQSGDPEAAMNQIRKAVKRDPDNIYLHTKLAQQYAQMQRADDFQAELTRIQALRRNPRGAGATPSAR